MASVLILGGTAFVGEAVALIKGMQMSFDWYTENNNRMEL